MAKRNTGSTAGKTTATKPKATKTATTRTSAKKTTAKTSAKKTTAAVKKTTATKTTTAKKTTTRKATASKAAPVKKAAATKTARKAPVKKTVTRKKATPAIPATPAFELFEGTGKYNHFFELTNSKGKVLVVSQGYGTDEGRQKSIILFRKVGQNTSRYNRFSSLTGEHFFRVTGRNGTILGASQMYSSKEARNAAIQETMNILPKASMKRKN